jgi:hypothetical protein
MSYTQFVATAKCQVNDNFNLNEYLTTLSDFIANHIDDDKLDENIRWEFEDYTQDEVIDTLRNYVRELGGMVLVECDTEERCSNSDLWDWLCDQVRQDVMESKVMEIHTATIDSRSGVDSSFGFYTKSGKWIGSDDIMGLVEDSKILEDA